ncbi:MAG: 16S rRNA (guanine(966)-N(2))-methyltransferase RsmD [Candidatus Puniceispirillum sp.]|nr:16S rRNA (guanine(966)-N(2))-methyltransferase RsmD [Candidatus Pelagibacter sp.]MBA4282954.1 16S rRNA (guanine(966)-N(2))-methyltransferase RsmD [Candidatus Puniceispirillum sp.]
MRIIAGQWRKQKLDLPQATDARPTKDRVKESLYNILESRLLKSDILSCDWKDVLFIDGFAGSGSIGIEAMSRGAGHVVFVENNLNVIKVLKTNISKLKPAPQKSQTSMVKEFKHLLDVENVCHQTNKTFGRVIIYLDPPYLQGLEKKAIQLLFDKNYFSKKGLLIIEESDQHCALPQESFLSFLEERYFGKSKLVMYEF